MSKSKRHLQNKEKVDRSKTYTAQEAISTLKSCTNAKFDETVELVVNLGVDPKKSDQVVRGATNLPGGTGKSVKVAVFAQGPNAEAAKKAGAEHVGMQDLLEDFQSGKIDVNVVIASPDAMGIVGRLGPILGPKGLMPNPKVGTVTPDVAKAVENAKGGQVRFKTDKNGIVHAGIGKISFDTDKLKENIDAMISALTKLKPANAKGVYIKKVALSTTMGPGLIIQP